MIVSSDPPRKLIVKFVTIPSSPSTWFLADVATTSVRSVTPSTLELTSKRFFEKDFLHLSNFKIQGVAELRCPGHQCNCYVEDEVIFGLLERDQQTAERYRKQMAEAYVVTNRALLHCTTPDCETVLQIGLHDHNVGIMVECQCGETLCSSCGEKWHDPVKCQLLKMWRKKCDDDR